MSLSVSDFNNFAAAAVAANASNPSSFAQQSSNPLNISSARSGLVVPNSSLPQSSFNFAAFGQYPQSASTSMTCNANFDPMAAMSASSSSNVNDVNAFVAAAAAANQQHSNNELKMMNECMMAEAAGSKRLDNNNVFGLSNMQEMDVMKLFQKNTLIQPGFGEMEEKMNAATKEQMQSSQLINGMKRQMVMPNSMNAALQSYHEQLAACMPPSAKRTANTNAYPMPAISQANASISQMSLPNTSGQMTGNGMHPNLMGMTSTPSNFMMANNGSSINSMAQSLAQHNMMSQQMPPVSSYPNFGALNGTINGSNSAAAMNNLQQQQQQQQNFQLAAAMNHQKHQNQLKAQQQMLQQQAKMHPQAAAMAQAQAAARAQAIREAQIMQQHQQRQQKLAASAMTAPLPASPQQAMNAQDYLTQRQLSEYTNLLRFQQQQQQQANLQHQQQQQMAQQQLMQQHQQAALLAVAQQEQQRRKASNNQSLVPITAPTAHSLAGSSSVTVAQSLGSQLANVMAAAARDTAQQNQQKTGLSNASKASYAPNGSIVPMPTSSSSTTTATASVISPLKGDSAIVINGSAINGTFVPAASMGHSGPDDERFQAFLTNIRLQYEHQLQQQAEINKTIINVNVAASLAQAQPPKSADHDIKEVEKPQENSVNKVQQMKQDAPNSPTSVDPVTI